VSLSTVTNLLISPLAGCWWQINTIPTPGPAPQISQPTPTPQGWLAGFPDYPEQQHDTWAQDPGHPPILNTGTIDFAGSGVVHMTVSGGGLVVVAETVDGGPGLWDLLCLHWGTGGGGRDRVVVSG